MTATVHNIVKLTPGKAPEALVCGCSTPPHCHSAALKAARPRLWRMCVLAAVMAVILPFVGFAAPVKVDRDVVVSDAQVVSCSARGIAVAEGATLRFATTRPHSLKGSIFGKGHIVFDCAAPITVCGDNLAFTGDMRIVRGEVRFVHEIFKYDDYAPSPTGGKGSRLFVDNSSGSGARVVFESKIPSRAHEFKCYSDVSVAEGRRTFGEAVVETRGVRNVTFFGGFQSKGRDAVVLAGGNLTFAGPVEVQGGIVDFRMTDEACKAGKYITFSGASSRFAGELRCTKGNVALHGPVFAPLGVHVSGGRLDAAIVSSAPGGVVFVGDKPEFRRTCAQAAPDGIDYVVSDWSGAELARGKWPMGDTMSLPARQTGYYWLTTSASNSVSFAIVPRPETRLMDRESPFGAVADIGRYARFDCPWMDGDALLFTQTLLAWCGIPWVRHYVYLPGPSVVNPVARLKFAAARTKAYEKLRVNVCTVVPAYDQSKGLADVYMQWKRAGEIFGTSVAAWEDLNEREAHDASWETAARVKAASLGLKAARPEALITSPSHEFPRRSRYDDGLYDNDLAKYIDFLNYHFYGSLQSFPTVEAGIRRQLARHGISDRDMWITERGSNVEAVGLDRPAGRFDCFKVHDRDQELGVAEFFPKMYLRHWMLGARRTFGFIFNPFAEQKGAKDWSFAMRRDGTVKPAYAAVSTMIRELEGCRFLGERQVIRPLGSVRSYLFARPDGTATLAYWSCTECDMELLGHNCFRKPTREERWFGIKPTPGSYRNVDMCGAVSTVKTYNGTLTLKATRFPQYVTGLKGIPLRANFQSIPSGGPVAVPFADDEDPALVVAARADGRDFLRRMDKERGYPVRLTNDVGRIAFDVWNLSDTPKRGVVKSVGCRLGGLPQKAVAFPPMGKFSFTATVARSDFPVKGECVVSIQAVANGKKSTRFAMPLLAEECQEPRQNKQGGK